MSPDNLAEKIPDFKGAPQSQGTNGPVDMTAVASIRRAKGLKEIVSVLALAVVVVTLLEFILIWTKTPAYVFPKPTAIIHSLFKDFGKLYWLPLTQTVQTFFMGLIIGALNRTCTCRTCDTKAWARYLYFSLHNYFSNDSNGCSNSIFNVETWIWNGTSSNRNCSRFRSNGYDQFSHWI
jgi:hypothetical protein